MTLEKASGSSDSSGASTDFAPPETNVASHAIIAHGLPDYNTEIIIGHGNRGIQNPMLPI